MTGPAATDPANGARVDATLDPRAADLRLARLHLRTGSYVLARAEYEVLVGTGVLDADALADLAEIRWRTGDLAGAGDAAAAHMEQGGTEGRALAIAAEAAAAIGRTGEARRLAAAAADRLGSLVDELFAGMPHGPIWAPGTFGPEEDAAVATGGVHAAGPATEPGGSATAARAVADGLDDFPPALPDPRTELEAARDELTAGDDAPALVRLAIALRTEPTLAPAILDLLGDRGGALVELLRGDAYRALGRRTDAQRAYAAARADAVPDEDPGPSRAGDDGDADDEADADE